MRDRGATLVRESCCGSSCLIWPVFLMVFASWAKGPNASILARHTFGARLLFFFGPMPVIRRNAASL